MSKYTTEVRYICENAAGLSESAGYGDVNAIVEAAYPHIFDNSLNFYNNETKARLLPKILVHYYTREIGFETVGLWKLKLNQKMREILPYYNQLYASEDLNYDPLKNVDNQRTHAGTYVDNRGGSSTRIDDRAEIRDLKTVDDGSSSFDRNEDTILRHSKTIHHEDDSVTRDNDTIAQNDDTNRHAITADHDQWVMYSDTPQGGINGVQLAGGTSQSGTLSDNAYLTNVTHTTDRPAATQDTIQHGTITNTYGKVTNKFGDVTETYNKDDDKKDHVDIDGWDKTDNVNTQTGSIAHTGTTTNQKNETDNGEDNYVNSETGKIGVLTYQEMVMRYRDTFLNIDMQIIEELDDLFMKVW